MKNQGDKELKANPDDILIFIDETGDENLPGSDNPIFGYGGIAVFYRDYAKYVVNPWREFKALCRVAPHTPLHWENAKFNSDLMEAFGNFFQTCPFHRFFTLLTQETEVTPLTSPSEITPRSLIPRLQQAIVQMLSIEFNNYQHTQTPFSIGLVHVIFEDSARGNPLIEKALPDLDKQFCLGVPKALVVKHNIKYADQSKIRIQDQFTHYPLKAKGYFMPKSSCEPGLEVAHWVINTAGGQARHQMRPRKQQWRRDYSAVFQENAAPYSNGMFMNAIDASITTEISSQQSP